MALNTHITCVLNGTIESVKSVIPIQLKIDPPYIPQQPLEKTSMSAHITIKGTISGQIIINGDKQVFSLIAEAMFGLSLDGDMLQSFTNELGNMIAGNLATSIANKGFEIDIAPPAIQEEYTPPVTFDKALSLPVQISAVESFTIVLLVKQ